MLCRVPAARAPGQLCKCHGRDVFATPAFVFKLWSADSFMPLTWPRKRRVTRRAEYAACYSRGVRRQTRHFVVFVLPSPSGAEGRLGLAVTRKSGCAVERNRIKRVLRSFFRLHQQMMPRMDIVVTPKRFLRAGSVSLALAEADLLPLLESLAAEAAGSAA